MELSWSSLTLSRWILLLLPVTIAVCDDVISDRRNDLKSVSCPTNCTCSQASSEAPSLRIDCISRTGKLPSLSEEIDAFLSRRIDDLVDLVINRTPLTSLPSSVCQLVHLQNLDVENNKLTSLPVDCFNKMSELKFFTASNNQLIEIQQGVFDGLERLQTLSLRQNAISAIGLHSFTSQAGLSSLSFIDLSYNKLTELEPWPIMRGLMLPGSDVDLSYNLITNFTNQLQWSFRCGDKGPDMSLNLQYNNIKHVTDMSNGWNITGEFVNLVCLFGPKSHSPFDLTLKARSFVCDCLDYDLYRTLHTFQHVLSFDTFFCSEPPHLSNQRAAKLPLEQFVCNISSPPCPEDCQCIKHPYNKTYVVTCRNRDRLPLFLPDSSQPPPSTAVYVLELGDSSVGIPLVEYREYFNNTKYLNVSGSGVKNVTNEAWRAFVKFRFRHVDLSNNQLTSLPTILKVENLTFQAPHQLLALNGNPFLCACEDRWMRDWLLSLGQALYQPGSVLCDNPDSSKVVRGKNVLQVTDDEFCYDPKWEAFMTTLKTVVLAVLGTLSFVGLVTSLLYRYRVKVYANFNVHPFDVDECEGEEMTYDIFLACAYQDCEVGRWIVDRLERQRSGRNVTTASYKVCYHERDFYPGTVVTANIQRAIERSRRVVCLMTRHFLYSEYCVLEFCGAWSHHQQLNKRRLLVIKWPEVGVSEINIDPNMTAAVNEHTTSNLASVKLFLSTHTYIEYGSENWWNQLIYSLPINSLPSINDRSDQELIVNDASTNHTERRLDDEEPLIPSPLNMNEVEGNDQAEISRMRSKTAFAKCRYIFMRLLRQES